MEQDGNPKKLIFFIQYKFRLIVKNKNIVLIFNFM